LKLITSGDQVSSSPSVLRPLMAFLCSSLALTIAALSYFVTAKTAPPSGVTTARIKWCEDNKIAPSERLFSNRDGHLKAPSSQHDAVCSVSFLQLDVPADQVANKTFHRALINAVPQFAPLRKRIVFVRHCPNRGTAQGPRPARRTRSKAGVKRSDFRKGANPK